MRQSIGNPTQPTRLPDSTGMRLQFPVIDNPEAINNSRLFKFYFVLFGFLFLWLAQSWLLMGTNPLIVNWGLSTYASFFGVLAFVWLYLTAIGSRLRWGCLVAAILAMVLAIVVNEPYVTLLIGAFAVSAIADLVATHTFQIETCAPMPPTESVPLRAAWRKRFWKIGAIPGAELYPITILLAPAAAIVLFYWELQFGAVDWQFNAFRCLVVLTGFFGAIWLTEIVAAFVWQRRARGAGILIKAISIARTDWLEYDRGNSQSPGVYKCRFGKCYSRWLLLGVAIAILTGFTGPAFQPGLLNSPYGTMDSALRAHFRFKYGQYPYQDLKRKTTEETRQHEKAQIVVAKQKEISASKEKELEELMSRTAFARLDQRIQSSSFDERTRSMMQIGGFVLQMACVPAVALLFTVAFAYLGIFAAASTVAGRQRRLTPEELVSAEDRANILGLLATSTDQIEKKSLFLGVNATDNAPVLVPREVFQDHAHILGDTGSGKTSIGIASIVSQLLRDKDCSVVVLDLKGDDLGLFEGVRKDCEQAEMPFRWFTNRIKHSTYLFNPLTQRYLNDLPAAMKAEIITNSLGLSYGKDYGRAFYSDANQELMSRAFAQAGQIESFRHLESVLKSRLGKAKSKLMETASHVQSIVRRLADSNGLNATEKTASPDALDAAIDFSQVFESPQTVYMHLSSGAGTGTAAEIARLALFSMLHSAYAMDPEQRVQTFVVIDEFQRIVSGNIEMILQLARSLNIGVILANQTMSDLKQAGIDLIPAVSANTRFRQVFAASYTKDQQELSLASGETVTHRGSWLHSMLLGPAIASLTVSENISNRHRINDLLLATDKEGRSLVQVRRGAGYAQYGGFPFAMQSGYTITEDEYKQRRKMPWPESSDETILEDHRVRTYESNSGLPPVGKPRPDLFVDDSPTSSLSESDLLSGFDLDDRTSTNDNESDK